MRLCLLGILTSCLLLPSVFAERYGSETTVTLKGAYYLAGTTATETLPNGDTRDTATHTVIPINNLTILQASERWRRDMDGPVCGP